MEYYSSSNYSQKMLHSIYYSSIPPLPIPKNYRKEYSLKLFYERWFGGVEAKVIWDDKIYISVRIIMNLSRSKNCRNRPSIIYRAFEFRKCKSRWSNAIWLVIVERDKSCDTISFVKLYADIVTLSFPFSFAVYQSMLLLLYLILYEVT